MLGKLGEYENSIFEQQLLHSSTNGLNLFWAFGNSPVMFLDSKGLVKILKFSTLWGEEQLKLEDITFDYNNKNYPGNVFPEGGFKNFSKNVLIAFEYARRKLIKRYEEAASETKTEGHGFYIYAQDKCCKKIDFIQIYWETYDSKQPIVKIDNRRNNPYYGGEKEVGKTSWMLDTPTKQEGSFEKYKLLFETCIVCKDPYYIIACVLYETTVTGNKQKFTKRGIDRPAPSEDWKEKLKQEFPDNYKHFFPSNNK